MNSNEQKAMRAPDLIEPVIGFRQWRLAGKGLLSIAFDERWREANLVARCLAGRHPLEGSPVSTCSCGVHAWYEPCPRTASVLTREYVAGAVLLWGAIELHATGMRAQHCRIVALALPLSRWGKRDRVVDVARHLGVPAVRHRDLKTIARQHGAPVGAELRPPANWIGSSQEPYGVVPRTGIWRPTALISGSALGRAGVQRTYP
jgi:hypothetical protein